MLPFDFSLESRLNQLDESLWDFKVTEESQCISHFSLSASVWSLCDPRQCTPPLLGYCWAGRGSTKEKVCEEIKQVGATRFDTLIHWKSLTTGSSLLPLLPSDVLPSEAHELGDGSRFSAEGRRPRHKIYLFKWSSLHKMHVSLVPPANSIKIVLAKSLLLYFTGTCSFTSWFVTCYMFSHCTNLPKQVWLNLVVPGKESESCCVMSDVLLLRCRAASPLPSSSSAQHSDNWHSSTSLGDKETDTWAAATVDN